MPIRVSRHVAKYLNNQLNQRIKLVESALLELHDIDNRLKMELLSLNAMMDCNTDIYDIEDDLVQEDLTNDIANTDIGVLDQDLDDNRFELVDLNDGISEYETPIDLIDDDEIILTDTKDFNLISNAKFSASYDIPAPAFGTFSFLSSLINDQSLRIPVREHYTDLIKQE